MKEAMFYERLEGRKVRCNLCAHACTINDGKRGICKVRENRKGTLYTLLYGLPPWGKPVPDPIEKKPLYHFHPGTSVASFGTVGCNLRCRHCQNYSTSQMPADDANIREVDLPKLMDRVAASESSGVAWTYNEPTIWFEFTYDGSIQAKKRGLYTVYVTNGFIQEEPLRTIAPYLDAMNIDVKAFSEDFYKNISQARLEPVKRTCELAVKLGIHIELTNLVIPKYNDNMDDIRRMCSWVREALGEDVPVHFSRFHPDYKLLDSIVTPGETLDRAARIAQEEGLNYIYVGNTHNPDFNDTVCKGCGKVVIVRQGLFGTRLKGLNNGVCTHCGTRVAVG